jgi:hypothetical protein
MDVDGAERRVRAEFEEMPDLTLTIPQASRLFGLENDLCRSIVDQLIDASFLRRTPSGAVTRGSR